VGTNGIFSSVSVTNIYTGNVSATSANFTGTLTSVNGQFTTLTSTNGQVTTLTSTNGQVTTLTSANCNVTGTLTSAALVANTLTLASSFVQTYTPSISFGTNMTADGSTLGYYFTIGALKAAWLNLPVRWTGSATATGTSSASLPVGFFTSIRLYVPSISTVGNTAYQLITGDGVTTSVVKWYLFAPGGANSTSSAQLHMLVIGT
jgi:hypothetical protein